MSYRRVLPRDLFNEAKLLKCLGFLTLHIHDGLWPQLEFVFDDVFDEGFQIAQLPSGELEVINLFFRLKDGRSIKFYTNYNSRENFPLLFELDEEIGSVFNDGGGYSEEFKAILN